MGSTFSSLAWGCADESESQEDYPHQQEVQEYPHQQEAQDCPQQQEVQDCPHQQEVQDCPHQQVIQDYQHQQEVQDYPHQQEVQDYPHQQEVQDYPQQQEVQDCPQQQEVQDCPHQQEVQDCPHQQEVQDYPHQQEVQDCPHQQEVQDYPQQQEVQDYTQQQEVQDYPHQHKIQEKVFVTTGSCVCKVQQKATLQSVKPAETQNSGSLLFEERHYLEEKNIEPNSKEIRENNHFLQKRPLTIGAEAIAISIPTQCLASSCNQDFLAVNLEADSDTPEVNKSGSESQQTFSAGTDCKLQQNLKQSETSKSTEQPETNKSTEETFSATCPSQTMATEIVQPAGEMILPQEPAVSIIPTASSNDDNSENTTLQSDGISAEDRLSSESSEPMGETETSPANSLTSLSAAETASGIDPVAVGNRLELDGKGVPMKAKKKEDKSIEFILRALSSLNSPEEKLAALCKRYADLHEEHRVLQSSFKQQQRKMTVVQREKDQLQAEHTKAVIAKSKLESLCRELQKQNKVVKEESLLRAKEEEERRKEISGKFQATIGEIQAQMTENHEKNVKLREENQDLAGKLKKFLEQYELREQQMEKLAKHHDLEQQLADAKLQQAAAILKEEQQRNIKEKELMILQATEVQKKNAVVEAQLTMYKDRYEEFQATINKSNDMFQKLKSEMDKMGKRIKKLEKEGAQWRAKFEASNKALLDMAEEKHRSDKEKQLLQTKIGKLESLCRALQGELHGKKASSPYPPSQCNDPVCAVSSSNSDDATVSTTTATTASSPTPANITGENYSHANPAPDRSWSTLPVPVDENGPVNAADVEPVSESSTNMSSSPSTECSGVNYVDQEDVLSSSGEDEEDVPPTQKSDVNCSSTDLPAFDQSAAQVL